MVGARLGLLRDVAVTNQPGSDADGDDYVVAWGRRGRIKEPLVAERALWIAGELLPDSDAATLLTQLPEPLPMRVGASWWQNLVLSTSVDARTANGEPDTPKPAVENDRQRPHALQDGFQGQRQ